MDFQTDQPKNSFFFMEKVKTVENEKNTKNKCQSPAPL